MDRVLLASDPPLIRDILEAAGSSFAVYQDTRSAVEHLSSAEPTLVLVHGRGPVLRERVSAIRRAPCGPSHCLVGLVDAQDLDTMGEVLERPCALDDFVTLPLHPSTLRIRLARRERACETTSSMESIYGRFFALSSDLLGIIGYDGFAKHFNGTWEATLGIPAKELRSRPIFDWIHPEDVETVRDTLAQLVQTPSRVLQTVRVRRADGQHRWLDATATSSPDERMIYVVARDVTEIRDTETALRHSNFLLDTILENIPDILFLKDKPELRILRVNRACETFLGIPRAEIVGRTVEELFGEAHAAYFRDGDRQALRANSAIAFADHAVETPGRGTRILRHRKMVIAGENGEPGYVLGIGQDVTDRQQLDDQLRLLTTALDCAANAIVLTNTEGRVTWANRAFSTLTGYSGREVIGQHTRILKSGRHDEAFYRNLWDTIRDGRVWSGELVNRRKDGTLYTEEAVITPVRARDGAITSFIAIKQDISARKELETQLAQARKLESVGQLAAGIAHEINTPTQYVGDNARFLQEAFRDLLGPLERVDELVGDPGTDGRLPSMIEEIRGVLKAADVDYLREEIPRAIQQSLEGIERVSTIVRAMKEFSHPASEKVPTDINHAIQTTVTVARNEWKYVAGLDLELDPSLPPVPCVPGEFNQVVLNLIVNAAHAIGERVGDSGEQGTITVSTRRNGESAEVRIRDSGAGIAPEVRSRIFDPFFTTKAVGRGTGQGLSIAHDVIVRRHGGSITVDSELGRGTCFTVLLPIEEAAPTEVEPT